MISIRLGRTILLVLLPITLLFTLILVAQRNGSWTSRDPTFRRKPIVAHNGTRENAAFVVLVRNSDLRSMRETMRQLEDRFNKKFNYPWIFLNNEPFDDTFKRYTTGLASGETFYGVLNETMWGYPDWIDQEKARETRETMAQQGVIYGGSESYRHMCR